MATIEQAPPTQSSSTDRRRWLAVAAVCLGQLMIVLDVSVVNVALPDIRADLGFSQADLTWVVDAYLITFGSFLLLAGRLGDLIGRKRIFLAGLTVFLLASLACGLAESQAVLIGSRFLQGVGGAFASSCTLALIVSEFPEPAERAKAMSLYTLVAVGGGSIGLVAGGVLTEAVNWHWIFYINIPIGLVAAVAGWRLLEENEGIGLNGRIDWFGSVLITAALMIGVYAIVKATEFGWGSAHTLGFGGGALALVAAFVALERRLANPIIPLSVLRTRGLPSSNVLRGLMVTGLFGCFFIGSLYLERVRGYGELSTGLAFLPQTLTVMALSLGVTAKLMTRFGARKLLLPGLGAATAGLVLLALAGQHTAFFPQVAGAFVLLGIGAGMSFMPLLHVALAEVPQRDAGLASGVVNVSMQVSAAVGLAVLGALAADRTSSLAHGGSAPSDALLGGYHLAFWIAAGCAALGAVLSQVILPRAQAEAS